MWQYNETGNCLKITVFILSIVRTQPPYLIVCPRRFLPKPPLCIIKKHEVNQGGELETNWIAREHKRSLILFTLRASTPRPSKPNALFIGGWSWYILRQNRKSKCIRRSSSSNSAQGKSPTEENIAAALSYRYDLMMSEWGTPDVDGNRFSLHSGAKICSLENFKRDPVHVVLAFERE